MKIAIKDPETEAPDSEEPASKQQETRSRHDFADDQFGQNFHRIFDAFISGKHPFFCPDGRAWNPPTDIFETSDALHVKMEVAGLRESDIEVKVNKDYLVIRGQRNDADQLHSARFHLMEIHYGHFERIVRLPHPVTVKNISAVLQNGFLKIRVPKDSTIAEYRIEIE